MTEHAKRSSQVKVEQPSSNPGLKIEKLECSETAASEIAMLKALLARKKEEAQRRELKLLELDKQNKRLKSKRATDADRIAELEAEVASLKGAATAKVKRERMPSPDAVHAPEEPILVMDSDGELENDDSEARPDAKPSRLSTPTSPGRHSPARPGDGPSRDAWSPVVSNAIRDDSDSDSVIQVKDEPIDVVIKAEGQPDQFKRVALIKSEDGNFDIWNVDGFGLGPVVELDEKYNRGFTRKVISDAFGGGHVACYHHFDPKEGQAAKTPFLTFNRSWNNALPAGPGLHGMGFFDMSSCPVRPEPVNFFAGEGTNDWRLLGTYDYLRWGDIAPHHVSLLPPVVLNNWVNGALSSQWGKSWIESTNRRLKEARKVRYTPDGVVDALKDGRMTISFTVLKCVGYPEEWFEKLLHYEQHPKPKKSASKPKLGKRRAPAKARGSVKKQALGGGEAKTKTNTKQEPLSDAESDELEEAAYSGSEYSDGPRLIAGMPKRTSPRKMARAQSVEV